MAIFREIWRAAAVAWFAATFKVEPRMGDANGMDVDVDVDWQVDRVVAELHTSDRFRQAERQFTRQYAQLYYQRAATLKPAVKASASTRWPGTHMLLKKHKSSLSLLHARRRALCQQGPRHPHDRGVLCHWHDLRGPAAQAQHPRRDHGRGACGHCRYVRTYANTLFHSFFFFPEVPRQATTAAKVCQRQGQVCARGRVGTRDPGGRQGLAGDPGYGCRCCRARDPAGRWRVASARHLLCWRRAAKALAIDVRGHFCCARVGSAHRRSHHGAVLTQDPRRLSHGLPRWACRSRARRQDCACHHRRQLADVRGQR